MSEFFTLNSDTEDKIISRQERIFSDTLLLTYGQETTVTTMSNAPRLKIKFFLDVVRLYDETTDPITDRYYRVGKYFELEHSEIAQHVFSQGFLWFTYNCTKNDGNGNFTFTLIPSDPRYSLYLSSIVFEDSFYNPVGGWLNPDNPNNLNSVLQVEELIGGENMDLAYTNISIRNISVAEHPISTYYDAYKDDFLRIGWYKAAATTTQLFVFPQGIHRVKENENTPKPDFPYSGSGAYTIELPLTSATIGGAAQNAQQLNEPHNIKTKYATTATIGIDIPEDEIGFDISLVVGAAKGRIFWNAVDGYTYGIELFGNVYNVAAAAMLDITVLYLGRNPTGYSPVPEN